MLKSKKSSSSTPLAYTPPVAMIKSDCAEYAALHLASIFALLKFSHYCWEHVPSRKSSLKIAFRANFIPSLTLPAIIPAKVKTWMLF
jgi:hypothetical protein